MRRSYGEMGRLTTVSVRSVRRLLLCPKTLCRPAPELQDRSRIRHGRMCFGFIMLFLEIERGGPLVCIVHLRILDSHQAEETLERELNNFLGTAYGKVPGTSPKGALQVPVQIFGAREQPVATLMVGRNSISSPGLQSGLRSQYQVPSSSTIF